MYQKLLLQYRQTVKQLLKLILRIKLRIGREVELPHQ